MALKAALRVSSRGHVLVEFWVNLALVGKVQMAHAIAPSRKPGRTPRWRGVTAMHEPLDAGIPVAIGGDLSARRAPFPRRGDGGAAALLHRAGALGRRVTGPPPDDAELDPMMVQHKIYALIQALLPHFSEAAAARASPATGQIDQPVERWRHYDDAL